MRFQFKKNANAKKNNFPHKKIKTYSELNHSTADIVTSSEILCTIQHCSSVWVFFSWYSFLSEFHRMKDR